MTILTIPARKCQPARRAGSGLLQESADKAPVTVREAYGERPGELLPVKPAARRRFAEGLIEPAVDVPAVRKMVNGLGVSNSVRLVMGFAWKAALLTVPARTSLEDAEEIAATAALKALTDFEARFVPDGAGWSKSRPPVEEGPPARARRFEPSEEDRAWAGVAFNVESGNSHAWDEYSSWADDMGNVQGWRDGEPESVAEVLSEACEARGSFVGHPA